MAVIIKRQIMQIILQEMNLYKINDILFQHKKNLSYKTLLKSYDQQKYEIKFKFKNLLKYNYASFHYIFIIHFDIVCF